MNSSLYSDRASQVNDCNQRKLAFAETVWTDWREEAVQLSTPDAYKVNVTVVSIKHTLLYIY